VDFHGIVIGEVRRLGVEYEEGGGLIRFPVEMDVYPDRLRSRVRNGSAPRSYTRVQNKLIVDRLVAHGMRGELKAASLLTGQLYIALDFHPDASVASVDWSRDPPVVPTIPGGLTQLQDSVGRIAGKLDQVPIERLSAQLSQALQSLDATLTSSRALIEHVDSQLAPEASRTLIEAQQTLRSANAVLGQEAPLQKDVHEALRQVAQSARAVAVLADYLERHPEALIRGKPADPK
jgi:paraquat-inducible protein B